MDDLFRIGLISTFPVVRSGLRRMLDEIALSCQHEREFCPRVMGEVSSLDSAEEFLTEIDALLMADDALEGYRLDQIHEVIGDQVPVLIYVSGTHFDQPSVLPNHKVWGFVSYDVTTVELEAALRALFHGLVVFSPALANFSSSNIPRLGSPMIPILVDGEDGPIQTLTGRENEILQLLAQGLANKQIAQTLQISEHTVKFHISSIYTKFGSNNRVEAVRYGIQQGFVSL